MQGRGRGEPTHVVTRRQPLDVIESHIDPHHAQDELVLEGNAGWSWVGPGLSLPPPARGQGISRMDLFPFWGRVGQIWELQGHRVGWTSPPGAPWDTAPPRDWQLSAVPAEL